MVFFWKRQWSATVRRPKLARGRFNLVLWVLILLTLTQCSGKKAEMTGIIDGKLPPCPSSPNCVSSQSADPAHFIEPIAYTGSLSQVREKLLQVLKSMEGMKVVTEKENYIHATATTRFFRFVDDVQFFFAQEAPIIHVRSASRVGYSDLGVNRRRIEEIRKAFASSN